MCKIRIFFCLFMFLFLPQIVLADNTWKSDLQQMKEAGNFLEVVNYTENMLAVSDAETDLMNLKKWQALGYRRIGKAEYSLKIYNELLAMAEHNKPSEDLIFILRSMGLVCMDTLNYSDAVNYFQKAKDMRVDISSDSSLKLAVEFNNLGLALVLSGKDKVRGKILLERALSIRKEKLGGSHPKTKITLKNLACAYLYMGRNDKSELYLLKAGSTV